MAGRKKTTQDRIIDSALSLAEEKPWPSVSLNEVALKAGCSLAELRQAFPTKPAILNGFLQRIDQEVLSQQETKSEESPRDRLFDVMMCRFDTLQEHRLGVTSIAKGLARTPLTNLLSLPQFMNSMAWMLEAAGINSSGLKGALKTKGLALLYGRAFKTWLKDDSEDMASTMAALDRVLDKADKLAAFCGSPPESNPENVAPAQN